MILAIATFVFELVLLVFSPVLMVNSTSSSFATFVIVSFFICTVTSIWCIFYNSSHIKNKTKPKGICVTGLVFSIIGAVIGLIFVFAFFLALIAY